jgi:hypothetical protein
MLVIKNNEKNKELLEKARVEFEILDSSDFLEMHVLNEINFQIDNVLDSEFKDIPEDVKEEIIEESKNEYLNSDFSTFNEFIGEIILEKLGLYKLNNK